MKTKRRWLLSVLDHAAKAENRMPWARGRHRAEMIARRLITRSTKSVLHG